MKKITLLLIVGFLISLSNFAQVAIGEQDGFTSAMPISGFYNYSYSQQIIFQNEINAEGDITSVSFYYSSGNNINSSDWTIYMGHTSKSTFESDEDWILSPQMSEVFNGTVSYPAPGNMMLITFDTPFAYNNLDNLVMAVHEKEPDYGGSVYFGKTSELGINRSIFYRSDNIGFDPTDPFMADGREDFINNIVLGGIQQICATPSELLVNDLTTTTALVSWTENGSATQWEVVYGDVGFDPATQGTTLTAHNNPEITITGLESASEYEFYVRAVCSTNDKSSFRGPTSFITACSFTSIPYVLDFENVTLPSLPLCTTTQNLGSGNNWKTKIHNQDGFNSTVLTYEYNVNRAANTWFYTQGLELLAGETYEVSYKYGNNSSAYTEKMKVALGTSPEATAMTEVLADHPDITGASALEENVLFTVPADGIYFIGFHAYSNSKQYYLYLDDVNIDLAPGCSPVSDLLAQNITTNSVDLSWTPGDSEIEWEINYGETGFDPLTQGQTIIVNNNPNHALTGLDQGISYDFYVTAICASGESDMVGPTTFTTRCAPASIPYAMDFETSDIPSLPFCTTKENIGNGNNWVTDNQNNNGFNSKVLKYKYHSNNAANAWFYTQGVTLEAGKPYEISYKYGVQATGIAEKMKVAFGTAPEAAQMTEELADYTAITNTNAVDDLITFTPTTTDVYYFGFNVYSDANAFYLFLDDISIEEAPSCYPVSDLIVENVTTTSADLSWTAGQSETEWEILYGPIGFDPVTEGIRVNAMDNPEITLTGLSASSEYDFYVTAICAVNDESEITGPASFSTSCPAATIPYVMNFEDSQIPALPSCTSKENVGNGNDWVIDTRNANGFNSKVLKYKYSANGAADSWFYTQAVQLEAGTSYEISYLYSAQSSTWTEKMKVAYGISADAIAMTEILSDHSEIKNTQAQQEVVRFTPATTDIYYFGFNVYSNANQHYLYVDDINIDEALPCLPVSDLVVDNVTANTADLSWTPGQSETEWKVFYGPIGFDPAIQGQTLIVNDTPEVTLTGLASSTEYDFYVTSICGAGYESEIHGPTNFNTSCGSVSIPYTMDFDTATVPGLPLCTSRENVGGGNQWVTQVYNLNGMSGNALRYGYNAVEPADAWFYTQGVELEVNVNYLISYKYFGSSNWPEKMKVAYGASASSTNMTVELADHSSIGGAGEEEYIFTVPANGVYYFGFNVYSEANQNFLYLDDIQIVEAPSCMPVTDLLVESITATSADLSWTAGLGETQWEVLYGEAGFDPQTQGDTAAVNGNPETTLNNLDAGTNYDFYVKAICAVNDESTWAGPETFITNCEPGQIPFAESFETGYVGGDALGYCWSQTSVEGSQKWTVNNTETNYNRAPRTGDYNIILRWGNEDWIYYALDLAADTQYELQFYARQNIASGASVEAAFGINNNPAAMTETIIAESSVVNGDYQKFNGYFTPTTSGVYYIGIKGKLTSAPWYMSIDDISIDVASSCPEPTNLMVDNITNDAADLSWTAGQDETKWEVIYGVTGFDPLTQGTTVAVHDDAETTITGLDANTSFEFYVKAICDVNDESDLAGPKEFTTSCVAGDIPFVEGFESYTSGESLTACWSQSSVAGTQSWMVNETDISYNRTPRSGSKNVTLRWSNEDWMFYALEFTAHATYELEFYARQDAATGAKVEAAFGISNNPAAMTNTIISESLVTNGDYQRFSGTFTPTTSGVYYVGIKGRLTSTPYYLSIDDISINEIITCSPVTDVLITEVMENSATVSWTASATATEGYDIEVYLEGENPEIATPQVSETVAAGITTVDITGLLAHTSYDVYVISDCGDDTAVSDVVNFTTLELGVNNNDLTKISYFPNPVKDQLTITTIGKVEMLTVTNLLGQKIIQRQPRSSNVQLDMSTLPVGAYILKVNVDSKISTFKVIKE